MAPSLYELLKRLKAEGYTVEGIPETEKEFEAMLQREGSVFGSYAKGRIAEFMATGHPEWIKKSDYEAWVQKVLTPEKYAEVVERYGEAPGSYMVGEQDGEPALAFACLHFGNVVLMPQPPAASGDDEFKIVHGAKVAPPHAYMAPYLWIQNGFKADALIHFGTHGSLEFTPGKQAALSREDWSDRMVGTLPHFYYYTIANVGEGIVARRRTYASLVSYLTPPFMESRTRGQYEELFDLIARYDRTSEVQRQEVALQIKRKVVALGLHHDLQLDSVITIPSTEQEIRQVESFAEEIANEKMTGMAIVCRNISEEEMQRRFFNMAVEESSIYPWQYNMHMNRFHFPGGLLRRFGYTDDTDLLARDEMDTLIHPEDLLHTRRNFDAILLGNEINSRMSFRLKSADGSYEWWEFRSTAYDGLTVDTPYMVLGVCQSIQRYKDTEEALIAARDRALQADKLKSAFLANMSHEIRTPLNAIVGFSDLLKDLDAFSPEEVKQFVETININCTLLLALINDILDLSRIESGTMDFKFGAFNLAFIMQEVHESQRLSMPRDVELRIEIPEGEDKLVITDSVRLKQVVNNLINNAKKFTVTGSITFGYVTNREGYTTIFVEDTGSGISEDAQKHIFERFYKEDSFTQGAGLGLSICQTIVDRLHGSISVSSELGKGTRFEVVIPDANE